MAIYFNDLDKQRNWRALIEELSLIAASGITGSLPGLYRGIRDAVTKSAPNPSIDERAGVWLRVTATAALLSLLNDKRFGGPLDRDETCRKAARDFLGELLCLNGFDRLDPAVLANPVAAPVLAEVMAQLPAFVRGSAPHVTASNADIASRYAELLRGTSARVHALDTDFYAPLVAALDSPFATGHARDLAWARHANWIVGEFHRPIFSLDADKSIPLATVYHRPRCYWHAESPPESENSRPRRTAHVGDLHRTLHAWLDASDRGDSLRVVAGGPGSGKSSFARAFAVEVIEAARYRVVFVPLHYMDLRGNLDDAIGRTLAQRFSAIDPEGSPGFPENPLRWRAEDATPILLVFDGLDELSQAEDEARDLTRQFILDVKNLLGGLNTTATPVQALILGRSSACQEGVRAARLPHTALLHVAPLTLLTDEILGKRRLDAAPGATGVDEVCDLDGLAETDERPAFWRRSAAAQGLAIEPEPEAVTAEELGELSAEPLLLHLLIVSGYTGPKWHEAAENRNRIYAAIFEKIHARDRRKDRFAAQLLDEADFFTLLECLGLAAWHGNGRTGSAEDFAALRDLHATGVQAHRFKNLPAATLSSMAVQFYTRRDLEGQGFEFIHKSFGEYLAARAVLAAGIRAARLMTEGEEPRDAAEIAARWTQLVDRAELSEEILRFLVDDARLKTPEDAAVWLQPLTKIFNWSLKHGMPVHRVRPNASWRELETMQRCAESALLAVLDALNQRRQSVQTAYATGEPTWPTISVFWPEPERDPIYFLGRIRATMFSPTRFALSCLDFRGAFLPGAFLSDAKLSGTDLTLTILYRADLSGADLSRANLTKADLTRADLADADLSHAELFDAELRGANLTTVRNLTQDQIDDARGDATTKLPKSLRRPKHWRTRQS